MKGNEYVAYTMLRKKLTANRGWILSNSIAWKLETTPLKLDEWIPNNDFFLSSVSIRSISGVCIGQMLNLGLLRSTGNPEENLQTIADHLAI